jgi:hypothetical protein
VIDNFLKIDAPKVRSLCWSGDALVDWVGGGQVLYLDGTMERAHVNYAFRFDSAIASQDGEFAVIYERLGTKGLALRNGKIIREINRSFYHAHVYEYPIAIFRHSTDRVFIVHCPNEYCQLEIENIVTGERLGESTQRKSPDFFHSRLRISPNGRWLLSAGWVWHPFSMVGVFDLDAALTASAVLDAPVALPDIDGEVAAAEFLAGDHMLIATSEETLDGDANAVVGSNELAVVDIATRLVTSRSAIAEPAGLVMPIDDEIAVGFFGHPKLFSLRTGAVLRRWEEIKSGNQNSSIVWNGVSTPPIAMDVARRRFAVAGESCVYVVQV